MGKMLFNIVTTFAEFEVDLLRMRTREGMAVARSKGTLRSRQPKLSLKQQEHLIRLYGSVDTWIPIGDLAYCSPCDGVSSPPAVEVIRRLPFASDTYRHPRWGASRRRPASAYRMAGLP